MERMLQLLLSFGEAKNYTLYGSKDPYCTPIILVWFRSVRAGAAEELIRAFASYRGTLKWRLHAIPSGWAVTPQRLVDVTAECELGGFLAAARILMDEEPAFGQLAHQDLESLMEHVADA